MNDFTKEELMHLSYLVSSVPMDDFLLLYKIQSLIDNYCEHESDGYAYYKSGTKCTDFLMYASSESPCLLKCTKCSRLFDDGRT